MGAVSLDGVIWGCYSRFGSGSVAMPQNPVRIPHAVRVKLACKRQVWVSSPVANPRVQAPDILAAARSRSRENNTQLFSNTLAPLRYPRGNTLGLWLSLGVLRCFQGEHFLFLGLSGAATLASHRALWLRHGIRFAYPTQTCQACL